jgi:hypothetical protein
MDWAATDITKLRPVASIAVLIMWWKFFYFLRIFDTTSSLVRMLFEIVKDMKVFTLILTVAGIAFANSFYILNLSRK